MNRIPHPIGLQKNKRHSNKANHPISILLNIFKFKISSEGCFFVF